MAPAPSTSTGGPSHSSQVTGSNGGSSSTKIAVTRDDVVEHLAVAIAGRQQLAHQHAQIVGEIGVQLLDRLVLAYEAAQFPADRFGARLEHRIGEPLGGLERPGCRHPEHDQQRRRQQQPPDHIRVGRMRGDRRRARRDSGRRTRRRRSLSETSPPSAASTAPNQIHGTSGL